VAAGDLLFARAFRTLVDLRADAGDALATAAVQRLARAARSLAEGEALQADQLRDVDLDEDAYLERCRGKTGVLFGAALALGGLAGGASDAECAALHRFGTDVGTAFQVADDILDLADEAQAETLGKLPHADLRDGTITLPMIYAMRADAALRGLLAGVVEQPAAVARRVRESGGIEQARTRAEELLVQARASVATLGSRFALDTLDLVADQAVHRLS
jgi:octaprenyl-diphosphate synthase